MNVRRSRRSASLRRRDQGLGGVLDRQRLGCQAPISSVRTPASRNSPRNCGRRPLPASSPRPCGTWSAGRRTSACSRVTWPRHRWSVARALARSRPAPPRSRPARPSRPPRPWDPVAEVTATSSTDTYPPAPRSRSRCSRLNGSLWIAAKLRPSPWFDDPRPSTSSSADLGGEGDRPRAAAASRPATRPTRGCARGCQCPGIRRRMTDGRRWRIAVMMSRAHPELRRSRSNGRPNAQAMPTWAPWPE
jgi:hypothetical protein